MQKNPAAALFILFLPFLGECLSQTEEAPYTVILSSVDMFHIFVFTIGIIDCDRCYISSSHSRWWLTIAPGKKEIILPPGEIVTNCDGGKSHFHETIQNLSMKVFLADGFLQMRMTLLFMRAQNGELRSFGFLITLMEQTRRTQRYQ